MDSFSYKIMGQYSLRLLREAQKQEERIPMLKRHLKRPLGLKLVRKIKKKRLFTKEQAELFLMENRCVLKMTRI